MPPSPSRVGLRIEALEDRTVPTALGSPWPNPDALTISFPADGTALGDARSDTAAAFGGMPAAVWQREVLRAFQTWAVHTNANIAVVADGGAAFGTAGQAQGDFRFGDIRVGAVPLSDDSLANVSAFDWGIGTWSGDLLFNTRARFTAIGVNPTTAADVFTVALHEAGHVFGMDHSADPASPMYEHYTGVKTGLTAGDIALVKQYYGGRKADQYEGLFGNNSFFTATPVDSISGAARRVADIGSNADSDHYVLLNTTLLGNLEVRAKASGISLLTPKVQVYDMWGRLVASATASGPGQDAVVTLPRTLLNLTYTVKVTGATGDVFGVGGYELSVTRTTGLILPRILSETLAGNSLLGAIPLDSQYADRDGGYAADAAVDSRTDVDYFSVGVPPTTDAAQKAMVVSVTNTSGRAHPELAVFDAAGRPVPFQVLNTDAATVTIQVTDIRRGEAYFVKVSNPAGADATGRYRLTADFQAPAVVNYERLAAGRLTASAPTATTTLTVNAARLFEFALATAAADSAATGGGTLTVTDATGKTVLALSRADAGTANGSLYLAPGTYTITFGAPAGATNYWSGVRVVSGPVGPYDSGTSTQYPSGSGDGTYKTGSSGTYSSGSGEPTYTSPPPPPPSEPAPGPGQQPNGSSGSQTYATPPPKKDATPTYYYSYYSF